MPIYLWKVNKFDFLIWWVCFFTVIFTGARTPALWPHWAGYLEMKVASRLTHAVQQQRGLSCCIAGPHACAAPQPANAALVTMRL